MKHLTVVPLLFNILNRGIASKTQNLLQVTRFYGGFSDKRQNTVGVKPLNQSSDASVVDPKFINIGEKVVFAGWRKILRKEIRMPTGRVTTYDIVTQKAGSVTVFVW
jgi:hypothetical protein